MSRQFSPDDILGVDRRDGLQSNAGELAEALATARDLEIQLGARDVHPSVGFVDRVMLAIVDEPVSAPAAVAWRAVLHGRMRLAVASVADAWRVATTGGRPMLVRAQAAALVLVVTVAITSLGSLATVGALRVVESEINRAAPPPVNPATTLPVFPAPQPTLEPTLEPTPEPTPTIEPSPSTEPSESPSPTGTPEPGDAAEPGSARSTQAPATSRPTVYQTPQPTHRPEGTPTATPAPPHDGEGSHGTPTLE